MKKIFGVFAMFVVGGLLLTNFASAGVSEDLNEVIDGVVEFFENTKVIPAILGDSVTGELLFAKALLFVIVLSIVFLIVGKIPLIKDGPKAFNWIIPIIVSILAIRWVMTDEFVQLIILPYSALGIAISAGLPFVIWFFVVESGMDGTHKTLRKFAWIFFMVVFGGLWVTRYDAIAGSARWIYPLTIVLALLMIFMDGTIQKIMARIKLEKALSQSALEEVYKLESKIREKTEKFAEDGYDGHGGVKKYEAEVKKLRDRITVISATS